MNTKKIVATMAVLALLVVSLIPAALADDAETTIEVEAGTLAYDDVPTTVAFTAVTFSESAQDDETVDSQSLYVQDHRGGTAGFNVTILGEEFSDLLGHTFALSNLTMVRDNAVTSKDALGTDLEGTVTSWATSHTAITTEAVTVFQNAGQQAPGVWGFDIDLPTSWSILIYSYIDTEHYFSLIVRLRFYSLGPHPLMVGSQE
jgi:hypothetical protein